MVQGIDATFSLLQKQQQDRADELARRRRDQELSDTILSGLLKGGLAIGNAVLANKTQDFLNTTEQRAATQIAAQADNNIARFKQEWDAINGDEQFGSPLEYLTNQAIPFMEAELKAKTPKYMQGLDEVRFQAQVRKAAQQVAQERLDILTEARDIYEGKDMNEFESRLDMTRSRYRATDLGELVTQMAAGLFDGKSAQDVDMQEMLDYKDFVDAQDPNSRAYHAKRLQELVKSYDETGDMAMAQVDATNKMIANMAIDPDRGPKTTRSFLDVKNVGGVMVLVEQLETTDMSRRDLTGKPIKTYGDPEYTIVDESKTITPTELLNATRSAFDLQEFYQNHLKPDGQRLVARRLRELKDDEGNSTPLSFGDIDTPEKYKIVADIMFDAVIGTEIDPETGQVKDPNLLKNDLESKNQAALYTELLRVDLWANYGEISSMDPNKDSNNDGISDQQEAMIKFFSHLSDIKGRVDQATGVAPAIQRNP
tara:strand:+ start:610 stop:2058 length:1449 start_codon:yes stop_codon:yes gene_type:complete